MNPTQDTLDLVKGALSTPDDRIAKTISGASGLVAYDLQAPAISLQPAIGEVLETLADEPETLLARMSGSGATCFALCAGDIEAEGLAERLQTMRPNWWVRRCRLGLLPQAR